MATAPPTSPYARPPRPLGVAVLAVLVGLFGVLLIVGGLLIVIGAGVLSIFGTGAIPSVVGHVGLVVGAVVVIFGAIILGLAVGLWHLRMWALALTLLVLIVELALLGYAGEFLTLTFLISLVLFIYLLAVNRHFR
jgi:hypothetical protein